VRGCDEIERDSAFVHTSIKENLQGVPNLGGAEILPPAWRKDAKPKNGNVERANRIGEGADISENMHTIAPVVNGCLTQSGPKLGRFGPGSSAIAAEGPVEHRVGAGQAAVASLPILCAPQN